jgi:hypothetical protein
MKITSKNDLNIAFYKKKQKTGINKSNKMLVLNFSPEFMKYLK